jgi:branched-chain amino acid transport system ATP-binding protein
MAELLKVDKLSAGYGEAVVLHEHVLHAGRRPDAGAAGPQRHRQDHADQHAGRRDAPAWRQPSRSARGAMHKLPSHERAAAGIGWVPQERNIFKSLTVHENLTAVARPGKWNPERRVRDVPAPGRAQDQPGHAAVGRRAADAGRGPGAGGQPETAAARRAAGRPGAHHRGASCCAPSPHHARRRPVAIIVEQHPQAILAISDSAVVLDHGMVVHADTAQALREQP